MNLNFNDSESVLNKAKELGIHEVRCSLTGAVIATLTDETLAKAIDFEYFQNPFMKDDAILDKLEMRWFIQSSRPAPHLTGMNGYNGWKFLRSAYPFDLFAILASRLLFESVFTTRHYESVELKRKKMQWLRELQDVSDSIEGWLPTLEALVRLDAIHSTRRCLYSTSIRELSRQLADSEFNFGVLAAFVEEVENEGFKILSTAKNPPTGNPMALSAALDSAGMVPEQLILAEEREAKIVENRKRAISQVASLNAGKSGSIQVKRGIKAVFALKDITGTLPAALEAKYGEQLENRKVKKTIDPVTNKARPSKAVLKAAQRFGNLDIEF